MVCKTHKQSTVTLAANVVTDRQAHTYVQYKVNGGNSGQRQFLQRIGRRRRPRWCKSFPTAACSVSYRRRCRRRPICCKNCRCPEFPPFTLHLMRVSVCYEIFLKCDIHVHRIHYVEGFTIFMHLSLSLSLILASIT